MTLFKLLNRLTGLVCRHVCRACIERCHVVAGRFGDDDKASAAFFNK